MCRRGARHRGRGDCLCCLSDPSQSDYTARAQILVSRADSCLCYFGWEKEKKKRKKHLLGLFFLFFGHRQARECATPLSLSLRPPQPHFSFPWPLIPERLANLNGRHNPEIVFQTEMVGRKIPSLAPAGRREEEREPALAVPKLLSQPEPAHVH